MTDSTSLEPTPSSLPDYTIIIEWENAIDVEMYWVEKALEALEAELVRTQGRTTQRPRILYIYNDVRVKESQITDAMNRAAPRIPDLVDLEFVPTPGLPYFKLKNYGVKLTKTDLVILLDSDVAPQEGWLEGMLQPFQNPEVMVVAGFTVLAHRDLMSKTMALVWVFNLPSEKAMAVKRQKIHANNCAFRTEFFQANPWPDVPVSKKLTGFWLQDIIDQGVHWVRTGDAMTRHAPHPGLAFLAWRAWAGGRDRDYREAQKFGRLGRVGRALIYSIKKMGRSTWRIVTKRGEVGLPGYQVPAALVLAWSYFSIVLVSQVGSALVRLQPPLVKRSRSWAA